MRQETLDEMVTFLTEMEKQLEDEHEVAGRRRALTSLIMRSALTLVVVLALVNGFFLLQLAGGLESNLDSAMSMSNGFTEISGSMQAITRDVVSMADSVQHLQGIQTDIAVMANTMESISVNVIGMGEDVSNIDFHMFGVDQNLATMEGDMRLLGYDVKKISGGVDKMATPMKMFNAFMPW